MHNCCTNTLTGSAPCDVYSTPLYVLPVSCPFVHSTPPPCTSGVLPPHCTIARHFPQHFPSSPPTQRCRHRHFLWQLLAFVLFQCCQFEIYLQTCFLFFFFTSWSTSSPRIGWIPLSASLLRKRQLSGHLSTRLGGVISGVCVHISASLPVWIVVPFACIPPPHPQSEPFTSGHPIPLFPGQLCPVHTIAYILYFVTYNRVI